MVIVYVLLNEGILPSNIMIMCRFRLVRFRYRKSRIAIAAERVTRRNKKE